MISAHLLAFISLFCLQLEAEVEGSAQDVPPFTPFSRKLNLMTEDVGLHKCATHSY
jgi:hypothetical protein